MPQHMSLLLFTQNNSMDIERPLGPVINTPGTFKELYK